MTEDEAKTKWCPFARTVQTDGETSSVARNRIGNQDTMATDADRLLGMQCIGSSCMAWRLTGTHDGYSGGVRGNPHGYCGLAGKP